MRVLPNLFAAAILAIGLQAAGMPGAEGDLPAAPPKTSPAAVAGTDYVPAAAGIPMDPGPAVTYRIGPHDLPKIEVFQVEELSSQKLTVTGHVKQPGVFPLAGQTTLMQAIAPAGGRDEVAKEEEIVVFRKQTSGAVNAHVIDLAAIEQSELTDPSIIADDRVVVPKSGMAVFRRSVGNVLTGWALRAPFL